MNKKELIKHIEDFPYNEGLIVDTIKISRKGLLELVKQLDEPEKVKIPQFVAEHIEWTKEEDFHLLGAMNRENFEKKLENWFYTDDNMELFARAWLDGYEEVEEEKRYTVKIIGITNYNGYLNYHKGENKWTIESRMEIDAIRTEHTRKQLEQAGFGEVFNSPLFEIEEVEE